MLLFTLRYVVAFTCFTRVDFRYTPPRTIPHATLLFDFVPLYRTPLPHLRYTALRCCVARSVPHCLPRRCVAVTLSLRCLLHHGRVTVRRCSRSFFTAFRDRCDRTLLGATVAIVVALHCCVVCTCLRVGAAFARVLPLPLPHPTLFAAFAHARLSLFTWMPLPRLIVADRLSGGCRWRSFGVTRVVRLCVTCHCAACHSIVTYTFIVLLRASSPYTVGTPFCVTCVYVCCRCYVVRLYFCLFTCVALYCTRTFTLRSAGRCVLYAHAFLRSHRLAVVPFHHRSRSAWVHARLSLPFDRCTATVAALDRSLPFALRYAPLPRRNTATHLVAIHSFTLCHVGCCVRYAIYLDRYRAPAHCRFAPFTTFVALRCAINLPFYRLPAFVALRLVRCCLPRSIILPASLPPFCYRLFLTCAFARCLPGYVLRACRTVAPPSHVAFCGCDFTARSSRLPRCARLPRTAFLYHYRYVVLPVACRSFVLRLIYRARACHYTAFVALRSLRCRSLPATVSRSFTRSACVYGVPFLLRMRRTFAVRCVLHCRITYCRSLRFGCRTGSAVPLVATLPTVCSVLRCAPRSLIISRSATLPPTLHVHTLRSSPALVRDTDT